MPQKKYHPLSILLHWLIFLLFVAALATIELRGDVPRGDPLRVTLKYLHMQAGQLIFLFVIFRIAARWRFGAPAEIAGPRWQAWGAQAVHLLLYFVMFALPVTGILFTQAGGNDVVFLGWSLPRFLAENQDLHDNIRNFHGLMGNSVYFLVGAHFLGALWHQFVRKDGIFQRMFWSRKT